MENERLKDVARELFGSETIVIWSTDWCVKPFSSEGHFSWHQDSTYSHFGEDALTIWIAFSDLDSDICGPVAFKKGSHILGQMPHVEKKQSKEANGDDMDNNNMLAFGQTIPDRFDAEMVDMLRHSQQKSLSAQQMSWKKTFQTSVAFPLTCGMASAHSFLTIHSSQANRHPNRDRVGLAIRLVDCEANSGKSQQRPDRVTLLCGNSEDVKMFGGFEPRPMEEFGGREMKEWQLSIQKENEFYFKSSLNVKEYTH